MTCLRAALLGGVLILTSVSSARAESLRKFFDLNVPAPESPVQRLNGLNVRAEFKLDTKFGNVLVIRIFNRSTGLPFRFDNADQLVTAISFDLGAPGPNASDPKIIGGSVSVGSTSRSINFDQITIQLGPGDDLSGEWGFGNSGKNPGILQNFVTATETHATPFRGTNLDGPELLNGPQGGVATGPPLLPLSGLGAVSDSVVIRVELDAPLFDLDFLCQNGVRAEFGMDSAYVMPEPATLSLLALGAFGTLRRRRSR
ncbi:MAG: PEP-CTERM sorting domain-containing protein [Planctomycetota bacterium]|nr:PEP-CTERM sorting domain-containing protein [Planctomycetota bacterium]MCZ6817076.1 PEP-CTERM sorting domain-containing protein [Planctomycetota bacterium]